MPKPAPKDAIALLKADHRKVADLFEKYEKARGKKAELAKQICTELQVHTTIEEEILYPACEGHVEEDMLEEAYVEHDGAKMMMAELEEGSPKDPYYAKMKVLSEEIKHHVKEEEQPGGLFAQLKKSKVDLKALGAKMAARKEALMKQIKASGLPKPKTRTMTGAAVEESNPRLDIPRENERYGGAQRLHAPPYCSRHQNRATGSAQRRQGMRDDETADKITPGLKTRLAAPRSRKIRGMDDDGDMADIEIPEILIGSVQK